MEEERPSLKMADLKILVRSTGIPGSWGKGDTLGEALKIASNPKYYEAFLVTYDTTCNSTDGGLRYDPTLPPRLIHSVTPKLKRTKAKP